MAYEAALLRVVRAMVAEVRRFLAGPLSAARQDAEDDFADLDFGALRVRLGRIAAGSRPIVDAQGRRISAWNHRMLSELLTIDLARETPRVRRLLDRFRRENVDLIGSIAKDLHADVRRVIRDATRAGTRVETLAKRIEERYSVTESRARLIARDQTLKANAALTEVRHADAGITRYVWSTSRDERVRPMHRDLEGRIFSWNDPPVTNADGDRNHPGEDYQCRCVAIPVLESPQP